MEASLARGRPAAALRAVVAVFGGYGLLQWAVALAAGLLAYGGLLQPSDAVVSAAMAGLLVYLAWLLWSLACPSLLRLGMALAGGCLALALAQWLLQHAGAA